MELAHMVMMMTMMMNIDLDSDGFILGCVSCMRHTASMCARPTHVSRRIESYRRVRINETRSLLWQLPRAIECLARN